MDFMAKGRKLKFTVVIFFLGLICCALAVVCYREIWINNTTMPEIVFYYKSDCYLDDEFADYHEKMGFIDKYGNVYLTQDAEIRDYSFEQVYEKVASGELQEQISPIGKVDMSELQSNYSLMKRVAANKQFELQSSKEIILAIVPDEQWYGVYFDRNKELQKVMLHRQNAASYTSTDGRTEVVFQWLPKKFHTVFSGSQ